MLSSYPNLRQLWKAALKICMHPTQGWSTGVEFPLATEKYLFACRMNEFVEAQEQNSVGTIFIVWHVLSL